MELSLDRARSVVAARPRRRHGCHPPWDQNQLWPWTSLGVSILTLYGLCLPILPSRVSIPGCACHALSVVIMQYFGWATILTPHTPLRNPTAHDACAVCRVCETVKGRRTHHCARCNLCVEGFDHHCVFLNCCIGATNYATFIGLVFFASARQSPHGAARSRCEPRGLLGLGYWVQVGLAIVACAILDASRAWLRIAIVVCSAYPACAGVCLGGLFVRCRVETASSH